MATIDTISCMTEPERFGWPRRRVPESSVLRRTWAQILQMGVDVPGDWYDGAVTFPEFDDDFVGSFLPTSALQGSCPTTESIANRVSGLLSLHAAYSEIEGEFAVPSRVAIEAGVGCLIRWQETAGYWAIHRYPLGSFHSLPPRDVSCQYATEAITSALSSGLLSAGTEHAALTCLRRFADYLFTSQTTTSEGSYWRGDLL